MDQVFSCSFESISIQNHHAQLWRTINSVRNIKDVRNEKKKQKESLATRIDARWRCQRSNVWPNVKTRGHHGTASWILTVPLHVGRATDCIKFPACTREREWKKKKEKKIEDGKKKMKWGKQRERAGDSRIMCKFM